MKNSSPAIAKFLCIGLIASLLSSCLPFFKANRSNEDQLAAQPVPISGSGIILTFQNANAQCTSTRRADSSYDLNCNAMARQPDGSNWMATEVADGLTLFWGNPHMADGTAILASCSVLRSGLSVTCRVNQPDSPIAVHMELELSDVTFGTKSVSAPESILTPPVTLVYQDVVLGDSPIGYWRFGESSGVVAADQSANLNNGTYSGAFALSVLGALFGNPDTSMSIGGNGYVTIPDSVALHPTGVSVEAWVKVSNFVPGFPANQTTDSYIVFKRHSGAFLEGYMLAARQDAGGNSFVFGVADAAGAQMSCSMPNVVAGQWYHVVGSFGRPALRCYLNGQLVSTATQGADLDVGTGPLQIGRSGESREGYFQGVIDEVALYSEALPDAVVSEHFLVGATQ